MVAKLLLSKTSECPEVKERIQDIRDQQVKKIESDPSLEWFRLGANESRAIPRSFLRKLSIWV